MISSVLVVVILGAVVAAITTAVLAEPQPATAEAESDGAAVLEPATAAAEASTESDAEVEVITLADEEWVADVPVEVPARAAAAWWRPTRSLFLLTLWVVALGGIAAVALAALVVAGAGVLDETLG